jgi:hypothetical protein
MNNMQERSEEQILSRLLELENEGAAERRVELSDERFLALIHDPDNGRSYVLKHGLDDTEGAEIPAESEFYEYENRDEAEQAFNQLTNEFGRGGEVVAVDSTEGIGDSEAGGAEIIDRYSADDDDPLIVDEQEET